MGEGIRLYAPIGMWSLKALVLFLKCSFWTFERWVFYYQRKKHFCPKWPQNAILVHFSALFLKNVCFNKSWPRCRFAWFMLKTLYSKHLWLKILKFPALLWFETLNIQVLGCSKGHGWGLVNWYNIDTLTLPWMSWNNIEWFIILYFDNRKPLFCEPLLTMMIRVSKIYILEILPVFNA